MDVIIAKSVEVKMILVIDDNWGILVAHRSSLVSYRDTPANPFAKSLPPMKEGKDYILASSFEDARRLFAEHRNWITGVIIDHNLDDGHVGIEVVRAIRSNPDNDHIRIARCSPFDERGYPNHVPHFRRDEFSQAICFVKTGRKSWGI